MWRDGFAIALMGSAAVCSAACASRTPSESAARAPATTESGPPERNEKIPLPMPPGTEVSIVDAMKRVIEVRGLSQRGEVRGLRVKMSDLLAHVERAVALETPERALVGTEKMLLGLGLVPENFQYKRTMLRLLSEKLAGLYDPHLNTMMIREELSDFDRQMTLLHELVHALQDQHYDLDEIVAWTPDDTDRSGALSCLAEGDATSAMFDGMLMDGKTAISFPKGYFQERMSDEAGDLTDVPTIIKRSLQAPYIDGLTFVHALRRRGGWKAVDQAWADPPTTTEQVLHLEKYDAREPAKEVAVPLPPHEAARLFLNDVWGEQNLRMAFEEWLDKTAAVQAAAGWGGDRIAAYQFDQDVAVAWHLVADDAGEARQMAQGFWTGIETTKEDPDSPTDTEIRCGPFARSGAVWAVGLQEDRVYVHSLRGREESLEQTCSLLQGWMMTHLGSRNSQD